MTSGREPRPQPAPPPINRRRLAFALFIFVWFAFAATASGRVKTIDVQTEFRVATSIVFAGNMAADQSRDTSPAADGKYYSSHLVGESLLLIPAALVDGGLLTSRSQFAIAMVNPLFAAAAVVILLLLLLDLGFEARAAVAVCVVFAFATIWWPYAHDSFDVTPAGFFLLLGLWAARRRAEGGSARSLLMSGVALGAGSLVRLSTGFAVVPVAAYIAWRRRSEGPGAVFRELLAWAAPIAVAAATLGALNLARYHDPLNIGLPRPAATYMQPLVNQAISLVGLWISPGKGMLQFSPIFILAIWGLLRLLRRDRAFTWLMVVVIVGTTAFYARLNSWNGDYAWGPRYLVPLAPLVMVLVAPVLVTWRTLGRAPRATIAALAAVGVVLNASVVTGYERVLEVMPSLPPTDAVSDPGYYFNPANSQVVAQLHSVWVLVFGPNPYGQYGLVNGILDNTYLYTVDVWWTDPWTIPALRPFVVLTGLLLALLVVLAGLRLLKAVPTSAKPWRVSGGSEPAIQAG